METAELVKNYLEDLKRIDSNKRVSSFNDSKYQEEILQLLKKIPKEMNGELVTKVYAGTLRKRGLIALLKQCRPEYYPFLIQAFKELLPFRGTEQIGMLSDIELFFLFELKNKAELETLHSIQPEVFVQERFNRNLDFILLTGRYTNFPNLMKGRAKFMAFAQEKAMAESAENTLLNIPYAGIDPQNKEYFTGKEFLLYWSLANLIVLQDKTKSKDFFDKIVEDKMLMVNKKEFLELFNRFSK